MRNKKEIKERKNDLMNCLFIKPCNDAFIEPSYASKVISEINMLNWVLEPKVKVKKEDKNRKLQEFGIEDPIKKNVKSTNDKTNTTT